MPEPIEPIEPIEPTEPTEPIVPIVPTVPVDNPPIGGAPTFKVPQEYADREWTKEIRSVDEVFQKADGLYKKLGANPIVRPREGASEDEISAYHKELGRPDTAEGYKLTNIEALKEVSRNPEADAKVKSILFKHGINKEVGQAIVHDLESMVHDSAKPEIAKRVQAIADKATKKAEYDKHIDTTFGEDQETTISDAKHVMKESLGNKAYLMEAFADLPNEQTVALLAMSKAIHDTYVGENRIPRAGEGTLDGMSGNLKTDFQTLQTRKANIQADKDMPRHVKNEKISQINVKIMGIGGKARDKGINLFA